jgi:hypothetical protein
MRRPSAAALLPCAGGVLLWQFNSASSLLALHYIEQVEISLRKHGSGTEVYQ